MAGEWDRWLETYRGLGPQRVPVGCTFDHDVVWEPGRLSVPRGTHDMEAEDVVGSLGGDLAPCLAWAKAWRLDDRLNLRGILGGPGYERSELQRRLDRERALEKMFTGPDGTDEWGIGLYREATAAAVILSDMPVRLRTLLVVDNLTVGYSPAARVDRDAVGDYCLRLLAAEDPVELAEELSSVRCRQRIADSRYR